MISHRSLLALVKFHFVACITTVRWRAVPAVYLVAFISFIANEQRDDGFHEVLDDRANQWDVGLWFLNDVFNDGLLLLLGFMLLVGDDVARGDKDGTLRSTLYLSGSRFRWWCAKIAALGMLALAYMSIVSISMAVASVIMRVPMGLHTSEASMRLADVAANRRWYALPAGWSTMGYFFFCVFSLAFTMWVIVAVHQALSLFVFPNRRIPFIAFFAWLVLGFVVQADAAFWDVRFLLYPGKVFSEFGRGNIPLPLFFGAMTALLLGATYLGHWRLSKMDV